MKVPGLLRALTAGAAALLAIWQWCLVPLRFELALQRLERTTLATASLPEDEAAFRARQTLEQVRRYKKRFGGDVRLAMIEGANERLRGQPAAAVAAYERALLHDRRPETFLNLALATAELGERDVAARHLAQAVRFAPEMMEAVMDPALRRAAISVIRGGSSRPGLCCSADYNGDGAIEVLQMVDGAARTVPGNLPVPVSSRFFPEAAWNDRAGTSVLARSGDGAVEWIRLTRNGKLSDRHTLPFLDHEWHIAGTGTFGSPRTSVLLSHTVTGESKLWELGEDGQTVEVPAPLLLENDAYIAGCADFNKDGHTDAVYRSSNGKDYILLLTGTAKTSHAALPPVGFQRELIGVVDLTRDSHPDLLWYDFDTGQALFWEMNSYSFRGVRRWP